MLGLLLGMGNRFPIPNEAMEPTLSRGATVDLDVSVMADGVDDVVVFDAPDGFRGPTDHLVARIVATSGQRVDIQNGQVLIDGVAQTEPYLSAPIATIPLAQNPIPGCVQSTPSSCVVPDGAVFVLGDNRNAALDSRKFGPIPLDDIVGHIPT